MPRIVATKDRSDSADAIREAAAGLQAGAVVGLPGLTGYRATALATRPDAVARLREVNRDACWLGTTHGDQISDFAPDLPVSVRRLVRRCWPGPLVVRVPSPNGAFAALDAFVQSAVTDQSLVGLTSPDHPIAQAVQALLPAPLVISTDSAAVGRMANAEEFRDKVTEAELVVDCGTAPRSETTSVVDVTPSGFQVATAGILSEAALRRSACCIYLFVCTGNTCRSPLAEGLFRLMLAEQLECSPAELEPRGFLIESAGLAASSGSPPSPESVELLQKRGFDLTGHGSQPLTEQLLNASDHVLTMTRSHRDAILRFRPDLADRVRVLRPDGLDIVDPIGGGMSEYERCEKEIEHSLRALLTAHFQAKDPE